MWVMEQGIVMDKIKQIRNELGYTLEKLAEKAGISVGYLCHLEKGTRKNPSRKTMERISKALNKTIVQVFFN